MVNVDFEKYEQLRERSYIKKMGMVAKVVGLTIESVGPDAKLHQRMDSIRLWQK